MPGRSTTNERSLTLDAKALLDALIQHRDISESKRDEQALRQA